jgi:hypothetical protein
MAIGILKKKTVGFSNQWAFLEREQMFGPHLQSSDTVGVSRYSLDFSTSSSDSDVFSAHILGKNLFRCITHLTRETWSFHAKDYNWKEDIIILVVEKGRKQ